MSQQVGAEDCILMTFIKTLTNLSIEFSENEPLAKRVSFRVGGSADLFVQPKTVEELTKICELCKSYGVPLTILGDGTNVLVADTGIRGLVVCTNKMNKITILEDGQIYAQAGARLSKVAEIACEARLSGFEFASGIPGTVGGAVFMNAGAYGNNIGEFCVSATLFSDHVFKKLGQDMEFGYRKSYVQKENVLVLDTTFKLFPSNNQDEIRNKMRELNNQRRQSQPLEYPSAGSTFKRPEGFFAGKLIQDAGLKGFTVGGAQVSEKHAGFVINKGSATAQDIYTLIEEVRKVVHEKSGVWLETEIQMLGF